MTTRKICGMMRSSVMRGESVHVPFVTEGVCLLAGEDLYAGEAIYEDNGHAWKFRYDACSDDTEDYRMLADHIIGAINTPDDDIAEVVLLKEAFQRLVNFVHAIPCICPEGDVNELGSDAACSRCRVLGRFADTPIPR